MRLNVINSRHRTDSHLFEESVDAASYRQVTGDDEDPFASTSDTSLCSPGFLKDDVSRKSRACFDTDGMLLCFRVFFGVLLRV